MSLSEFTDSYIAAALWLSCDDGGTPLDTNHDESNLAPETLAAMKADCAAFYTANKAHIDCDDGCGAAMAGHDFWLTRNGHGAGFWDGDWPDPHASVLDDASQAAGEVTLYIGDDGKIYAM